MGKTIRGEKGPGYDYWKSRYRMTVPGGEGNNNTKRMTNRYERRKNRKNKEQEERDSRED